MREVNYITRYHSVLNTPTAGAGVYLATTTLSAVTGPFPIILTGLFLTGKASDSITDQNIEGNVQGYLSGINVKQDNPGFVAGSYNPYFGWALGIDGLFECYYSLSPSTSLGCNVYIYLSTVTANPVSVRVNGVFRYLCPEDYMSVDVFAANPI